MRKNRCISAVCYALIIMLICAACSTSTVHNPDKIVVNNNYNISADSAEIISLQENLCKLRGVDYFFQKTDTSFIVSDAKSVVEYSYNGQQIRTFGEVGNAKNEYISVGGIFASSRYVYVWCSTKMKLKQYDFNGKFVNEFAGPSRRIRKFAIMNDSVVAYHVIGLDDQSIDIVVSESLLTDTIANSVEYGDVSFEDITLYFKSNSGGLTYFDDKLYFARASRLNLYEAENKEVTNCFELALDGFTFEEVEKIPRATPENPVIKLDAVFEYIFNNGVVTGVHPANTRLCLIAETRKTQMLEDRFDVSDRRINLIFFDPADKTAESFQLPVFENCECYTYSYPYLNVVLSNDEGEYELKRIKVGE